MSILNFSIFAAIITLIFVSLHTYIYYSILAYKFSFEGAHRFVLVGIGFFTLPTFVYLSLLLHNKYLWIILDILFIIYFIKLKLQFRSKIIIDYNNNYQLLIICVGILTLLYSHFYDAFTNISMTHPDNFSNFNWAHFHSSYETILYPPGISGILIPIMNFVDIKFALNFIGAILGILTFCIILQILSVTMSKFELILLSSILISPLYNVLTLARIGIHTGAYFPILVVTNLTLIVLMTRKARVVNDNQLLSLFLITFLQAGIIAPHQTFTLVILNFSIISLFAFSRLLKYQFSLKIVAAICLGFALSILYISSSRLKSIESIIYSSSSSSSSSSLYFFAEDYLSIKFPIRPIFESNNSMFAYLALFFSIAWLIVSYKRKDYQNFIIGYFTVFYGVVTQTGIFELSYTKGRAGWNFMMLFAIAFTIVATKLLDNFPRKFTVVIPLVIMLTSLLYPPIRYRIEPEEALTFTRTTLQVESMRKIDLYSDFSEAQFIDPRVNLITDIDLFNTDFSKKYVLLNMDVTLPDKFLANIRKYEDRNFAKFDEEQQNIMTKRIDRNIKLVSLLKQKGFEIISNSNLYYLFRN
jgi:hypothetical protein